MSLMTQIAVWNFWRIYLRYKDINGYFSHFAHIRLRIHNTLIQTQCFNKTIFKTLCYYGGRSKKFMIQCTLAIVTPWNCGNSTISEQFMKEQCVFSFEKKSFVKIGKPWDSKHLMDKQTFHYYESLLWI